MKHQRATILQKAAMRSVSNIPHLRLELVVAMMASLAMAIPWLILLSPPDTSCSGEMVLCMVARILAASIPVRSLKSRLSRESFLLSEILRLLAFLPGLLPKTIREVL